MFRLLASCLSLVLSHPRINVMLHCNLGDLKTFLLARRQLVGLDTKEGEDITPSALTKMALDVAFGLQYLTELKYVHRFVPSFSTCL